MPAQESGCLLSIADACSGKRMPAQESGCLLSIADARAPADDCRRADACDSRALSNHIPSNTPSAAFTTITGHFPGSGRGHTAPGELYGAGWLTILLDDACTLGAYRKPLLRRGEHLLRVPFPEPGASAASARCVRRWKMSLMGSCIAPPLCSVPDGIALWLNLPPCNHRCHLSSPDWPRRQDVLLSADPTTVLPLVADYVADVFELCSDPPLLTTEEQYIALPQRYLS
ncbi:hypothetical protein PYCCODRAFT_1147679 [Trametes coccinea BRFM310]|uniref:Uncharacterized protein n=1 Tax=Trametes coccinea (strain BRFM310) TaxID=1353009 RepID=A0A1Y2I7X2_TRAC3|nr:hypothetical protein PYCCODRAFT_1147679 [Trametes coccinea BRFM310]